MTVASGSTRKLVTMPDVLVSRIQIHQQLKGLNSEAKAIRELLEVGLNVAETPESKMLRCKYAHDEGRSFGWIVSNILDADPLLIHAHIDEKGLRALFNGSQFLEYSIENKTWLAGDAND